MTEPSSMRAVTPRAEAEPQPDKDDGSSPKSLIIRFTNAVAPLLGEHAADIIHALDRWFETIHDRLLTLEAAVAGGRVNPEAEMLALRPAASQAGTMIGPVDEALALPTTVPELIPKSILQREMSAGWIGWSVHGEVTLKINGVVEIRKDKRQPGIVTDLIWISGGGLYRVYVVLADNTAPVGLGLILRLTDAHNEPMGPDCEIRESVTECFFFVSHRVKALKLFIVSLSPHPGLSFAIRSVAVDKIDEESYFRHRRHGAAHSAIASMASIPSRRHMMRDAVESLLLQCDLVRVFLNEYPEIPDFLHHPRIQIRRSQDWDDKGDAGKFSWIGAGDDQPGYRVIADDDLLYAPDFVGRMVGTLSDKYRNRAFLALHGVLLRQPITYYYDSGSRSVIHFQSALQSDRTVHVVGTNALVYHSDILQLRSEDFMFRNMADIFVARYAQRQAIPMIAAARPRHWVRQNGRNESYETIYESSRQRTRSKFDSSLLQDSLLKQIAPLTLQPTHRPKVVLCVCATTPLALDQMLDSWRKNADFGIDWVIVLAAAAADPLLLTYLNDVSLPSELHIVVEERATAAERVAKMLALAVRLRPVLLCVASDAVRFEDRSWARKSLRCCGSAGGPACFIVSDGTVAVRVPGQHVEAVPLLAALDPAILDPGWFETILAKSPAEILRNLMERFDRCEPITDTCPRVSPDLLAAFSATGTERAGAALSVMTRVYRALPVPRDARRLPATMNQFFERVAVINLDRRADRWATISIGLDRAGITAERFRAVDGAWAEIARDYAAYAASPLATVGSEMRSLRGARDYYFGYMSQRARVAHIETTSKSKAITSAGAWGYLKSWEMLLEQALRDRTRTLLVLDDDAVFHRELPSMFADAATALPADWMMLQMGTLQYHWDAPWMVPHGPFLYRTNGSAIGSHGVGLSIEIMPFLLEQVKRMELPFDTGALSAATRAFADRCFVITPNLAIQRLGDSDIHSSAFQRSRTPEEVMKTYRWNPEDYVY